MDGYQLVTIEDYEIVRLRQYDETWNADSVRNDDLWICTGYGFNPGKVLSFVFRDEVRDGMWWRLSERAELGPDEVLF